MKSADFWSEWRDLNPRPLGPEPSALPTALHPVKKNRSSWAAAVWLGMRGSNSHGRSQSPLHYHYANPHRVCVLGVCPQRSYIIACPMGFVNAFFEKTSIFSPKFSIFQNSSLLRQSFSVIRCRWISLTAGGTFIPWAIPHNSKCRYGERGAAAAKPKAQIILCVLSSILATQMPCRSRRSGA